MINGVLKFFIKSYQLFVRPLLVPACRFHPSCSEYALQALNRYGFFGALRRILFRLLKCQPFHDGGFDPLK